MHIQDQTLIRIEIKLVSMNKIQSDLIKKYHREITHLKYKLSKSNFGLCFGAGISKDLGYPLWPDLVKCIADKVDASHLYKPEESLTSTTQLLFAHYRANWIKSNSLIDIEIDSFVERKINISWLKVIHYCLYIDIEKDVTKISHPYLLDFLDVVEDSVMTINYNFDDTIERLLFEKNKKSKEKTFETVWKPSTQFRRQTGIIYHPNGFLPLNLIEGFSEHFVFGEESYIDQSLDNMAGHYSCLLNHVSRYTLLILGMSLNDPTLKQILRQNARLNPGHYHFYVKHIRSKTDAPSDSEKEAIIYSNLKVYNLVTLFLTSEEISSLGKLLNERGDDDFKHITKRERLPISYHYYISGSVGSGKSTVVNNLRSFKTFDEWLDPKPDLMEKPAKDLTEDEKDIVNQWIDEQFSRKNFKVGEEQNCISVIDRSPIDPLAFQTDKNGHMVLADIKQRAEELTSAYKPSVVQGCVIVLKGDEKEFLGRVISRHKNATIEYIQLQQDFLISLFPADKVYVVETSGLTEYEVAKKIASIILTKEYLEIDFDKILEDYIKMSL